MEVFIEALELEIAGRPRRLPRPGLRGRPATAAPCRGAARSPRPGRRLPRDPRPAPTADAPADEPARSRSPARSIGPYKLLEQIGEGGMGVVYMAEQTQPVRRKVALKVIKPGMDTKQVIARFEAERQALALMDHPNIARVLEPAPPNRGRPYFVMELVRGIPITEYCDREQLVDPRAAGAVRPGLPGRAARPPEGDHPPRPEALERPGDAARRRRRAQGHRLRRGQGDRPER